MTGSKYGKGKVGRIFLHTGSTSPFVMRVCFLEGRTGEEKKNTFYFNKFCFHTLKRGESGKVELSFPPSPLPLFNLDGIKIRLKPARVGKKEGGFLLGASVWLAGSGGFLNMRNKPNKQPYCFPPFLFPPPPFPPGY